MRVRRPIEAMSKRCCAGGARLIRPCVGTASPAAGRRALPRAPGLVSTALLVAVACVGAGCGTGGSGSGSGKGLEIVATTTQLGDFVRAVGGASVDVHQILKPNTDPHEYEPRPLDIAATSGARIVFLSGNNLDGWMAKVIDESGGRPTRVTIAPRFTPYRLPGEAKGPEASKYDPHWWHDPRNAEAAVAAIRDALARADPAGAARFTTNANAYLAKLHTLDVGIARCFDQVPRSQRKLVTSHDAFDYFARRYAIRVVGAVIPAQTTQAQPSAGALARLTALVRREHVKAIFPESSLNPKLERALAEQTGASAAYTLYGDTLGPAGSPGATYLSMEQANADSMIRGMTGGRSRCVIPRL